MKTPRVSRARTQQRLIRTILVPVDFSDCSLAGLTYAVRFAKEVGARIAVVHVADLGPVMMTTGSGDYDSPTYAEAARRRCGDQMKAFLKPISFDGVPVPLAKSSLRHSARIIESFERTLEKPEKLLHVYELLNRIRLCASDAVLTQGRVIRSNHSGKRAVSNLNRSAQRCSRAPFAFCSGTKKMKFWARNGQCFAIRGIAQRRRRPE